MQKIEERIESFSQGLVYAIDDLSCSYTDTLYTNGHLNNSTKKYFRILSHNAINRKIHQFFEKLFACQKKLRSQELTQAKRIQVQKNPRVIFFFKRTSCALLNYYKIMKLKRGLNFMHVAKLHKHFTLSLFQMRPINYLLC